MEINILEQEGNILKIEIKGEGHTLCNALRKELWNDKETAVAGYNIDHPLVGQPILILETQKENPKKVLLRAIEGLKKKNKELLEEIDKIK